MVAALVATSKKHPSAPNVSIKSPLSPSENYNTSNRKEISVSKHTSYASSPFSSSSFSCVDTSYPHITNAGTPRTSAYTSARSLSVAFQTNNFSLQIRKPKPATQNSLKKTVIPRPQKLSSISKRLDCSFEKKEQAFPSIKFFAHSDVSEDKFKRATSGGNDPCFVSHTTYPKGGNDNFASVKGLNVERRISCSEKFMAAPRKNLVVDMPSVLNFRVKQAKKRIEEAHSFRLLFNRYLQWRFVNARVNETTTLRRINIEEKLYNVWLTILRLRYSVRNKRIEIQNRLQYAKLHIILQSQISQLEEWSQIEMVHYNHILGIIKALTASTIRLPVISGAMVNMQDMKNAVGSAIDVMQAIANPTCSLLLKVNKYESPSSLYSNEYRLQILMRTQADRMSRVASEMAKIVAKEQDMLRQSKNLLSTFESLLVKQSSLHVDILQLKL